MTTELEQTLERLRADGFYVSAFLETDSRGAAHLLGWTRAYLANRRAAGAPLPPGHRFGRSWLYRVADVIEWRRSREVA
ncbi:MAG TPA: hypothetical protein VE907_19700 [Gammaproteobacteria bacterium]|nr:hypothetical protein [Gammaproteobacteria bacterium]